MCEIWRRENHDLGFTPVMEVEMNSQVYLNILQDNFSMAAHKLKLSRYWGDAAGQRP